MLFAKLRKKSSNSPEIEAVLSNFEELCAKILEIDLNSLKSADGEELTEELEMFARFLLSSLVIENEGKIGKVDVEERFGVVVSFKQIKELRESCRRLMAWLQLTFSKSELSILLQEAAAPLESSDNYDSESEDVIISQKVKIQLREIEFGAEFSWPEISSLDIFEPKSFRKQVVLTPLPTNNANSGSHSNSSATNNYDWLRENCEIFIALAQSSGESLVFSNPNDLLNAVHSLIISIDSAETLQGQLIDLLGFGEFSLEFITNILSKRDYLKAENEFKNATNIQNESADFSEQPMRSTHRSIEELERDALVAGVNRPEIAGTENPNSQITRISSNVATQPLLRSNFPYSATGHDISTSKRYVAPQIGSRVGKRAANLNEIVVEHKFMTGPLADLPPALILKGADVVKYKEVFVPHLSSAEFQKKKSNENLPRISIKEFHPKLRSAFGDIQSLNQMQSIVFPEAYKTTNNLLICSPTGSGKTNVAMTTIVKEIERNLISSENKPSELVVDRKNIKIVYVAPMKALAAEIVSKFSKRLAKLMIRVRELTGDMQMTKNEIEDTQVIVTTPEKWDVITRKGDISTSSSTDGSSSLVGKVRLMIIDEIHLLGEDRGYVLECVIARLLRLSLRRQTRIRMVGLSATLPNFDQVGRLLMADPSKGVFFFGAEFRPVPLDQKFIGVNPDIKMPVLKDSSKEKKVGSKEKTKKGSSGKVDPRKLTALLLNEICWKQVLDSVKKKNQVMIFVHSRKDTSGTVRAMQELNSIAKTTQLFVNTDGFLDESARTSLQSKVKSSPNSDVREFFGIGFGIHHAGMLRSDRDLVENLFSSKALSVLVCTATLAWGVNLPAQTVVIKGTEVYAPGKKGSNAAKGQVGRQKGSERSGMTQISMQDVLQCFGRAGRPQFDKKGLAVLITDEANMNVFLRRLTNQIPLESNLIEHLADCLNAEIVSGSVTSLAEAVEWLGFTFLFVRMFSNPISYGISQKDLDKDPNLTLARMKLAVLAANQLEDCQMVKFGLQIRDVNRLASEDMEARWTHELQYGKTPFGVTNLGRVGSHYYLSYETIERFNTSLSANLSDVETLRAVLQADEFEALRVREDEISELNQLKRRVCVLDILDPIDSPLGKCQVLCQAYILKARITTFTLVSDMNYISKNLARILSAAFEIALRRRWANLSKILMLWSIAFERRCIFPPYNHVLSQFAPDYLRFDTLLKIRNNRNAILNDLDSLIKLDRNGVLNELGRNSNNQEADSILKCTQSVPFVNLEAEVRPITHDVLSVKITMTPSFRWNDRLHGHSQPFYLFVEDEAQEFLYQHDRVSFRREKVKSSGSRNSAGSSRFPTFHDSTTDLKPSTNCETCLTIRQPWATLLVNGLLRSYYRKSSVVVEPRRIYIRSSNTEPDSEVIDCFKKLLGDRWSVIEKMASFPLGCILGDVKILGCYGADFLDRNIEVSKNMKRSKNEVLTLETLQKELQVNRGLNEENNHVLLFEEPRLLSSSVSFVSNKKVKQTSLFWEVDEFISQAIRSKEICDVESTRVSGLGLDLSPPTPKSSHLKSANSSKNAGFSSSIDDGGANVHQTREFFIPVPSSESPGLNIVAVSPRFYGAQNTLWVPLEGIVLPKPSSYFTRLLDVPLLPISILKDERYLKIFRRFSDFFSSEITMALHSLFNTDDTILFASPNIRSRRIAGLLCFLRLHKARHSDILCKQNLTVFVVSSKDSANLLQAWLKRVSPNDLEISSLILWENWEAKYEFDKLSARISTTDALILTPGTCSSIFKTNSNGTISNISAEIRDRVGLLVLDDLENLNHNSGYEQLLANVHANQSSRIRIVGLSGSLSCPMDLYRFLSRQSKPISDQVAQTKVFNFRPLLRKPRLEVHIQSFPEHQYLSRMAAMNKPILSTAQDLAENGSTLVFVQSKQQVLSTVSDLISLLALSENPRSFLDSRQGDIQEYSSQTQDPLLVQALCFGIVFLHSGLQKYEKDMCIFLYKMKMVRLLVCHTNQLRHLEREVQSNVVIIKGTLNLKQSKDSVEHLSMETINHLLEKSNLPNEDSGVSYAVLLCYDLLKPFYKKFLNEPFPIESKLASPPKFYEFILRGLNTKEGIDAPGLVQYLINSFYYMRLRSNPSHYGYFKAPEENEDFNGTNSEMMHNFLRDRVLEALSNLKSSGYICEQSTGSRITFKVSSLGNIFLQHAVDFNTPVLLRESMKKYGNYYSEGNSSNGNQNLNFIKDFIEIICTLPELVDIVESLSFIEQSEWQQAAKKLPWKGDSKLVSANLESFTALSILFCDDRNLLPSLSRKLKNSLKELASKICSCCVDLLVIIGFPLVAVRIAKMNRILVGIGTLSNLRKSSSQMSSSSGIIGIVVKKDAISSDYNIHCTTKTTKGVALTGWITFVLIDSEGKSAAHVKKPLQEFHKKVVVKMFKAENASKLLVFASEHEGFDLISDLQ